ncbi:MAG: hypothetical protein LBC35_01445 [Coriobacteriales bacterium]|jgi:hypothetical protein|nr:hypothetical protein [Coriobacteriales bacterium]
MRQHSDLESDFRSAFDALANLDVLFHTDTRARMRADTDFDSGTKQ